MSTDFLSTEIEFARSSPLLDAFARQRVSHPNLLFSTTNIDDNLPFYWEDSLTGGATATRDADRASVLMEVGTTSGAKATRQTRFYHPYQPGRSLLILSSLVLGAASANRRKRVGYFDDNDGIFLEQTNSALSFVRRTSTSGSPVEAESIAQASWNIDAFDGTGPSGVTLDVTKAQILLMDYEWLGVGRVRVGFVIDGAIYYAHEFLNANSLTSVYMRSGRLPYRFEIENTAAATGTATLEQICYVSLIEGDSGQIAQRHRSFVGDTAGQSITSGTEEAILAVRLTSSFNQNLITPVRMSALADGNNNNWDGAVIRLYIAPPGATSGTWAAEGGTYCEKIANPTGFSTTDLRAVASYLMAPTGTSRSGSTSQTLDFPGLVGRDIDGSVDELIVTAESIGATATYVATLDVYEIF